MTVMELFEQGYAVVIDSEYGTEFFETLDEFLDAGYLMEDWEGPDRFDGGVAIFEA